jgi:hypothetical protein
MKTRAVWLMAMSVIVLAAQGCYNPPHAVVIGSPCPPGQSTYESRDVALRLYAGQVDGSYRLPLGKIVVSWSGVCAEGNALQPLGSQSPSVSPGENDYRAFRAVRIGRAVLTHPYACGEACQKPMQIFITVTDGCQLLSRTEVVNLTLPQYPIPPPQLTYTKLMHPAQYDHVFGTKLDLPADTLVWAVLTAASPLTTPTPPTPGPLQWRATAVDACTNWTAGGWSGDGEPAGWRAVADQSSGA